MRRKLVAFALFALLLTGGAFAYWHWSRTPTYSLRQIHKALQAHDVAKFEKHVDVKSVSSQLIDHIMGRALKESQPTSGAEALGTAFAAGLVQLMKPRLVEAIQEQAARLVETGHFGSSTPATSDKESDTVTLQGISEEIGADKDSFKGITYIKKRGKIALVGWDSETLNLVLI